jgi:hypothetical protein
MQNKFTPNKLQKHHYVPKFYLSKWCVVDQDFFWVHTKTAFNEIKIGLKPPSSISFERGLYATSPEGFPFDTPASSDLEKNFFRKIDDAASIIHLKLINSGVGSISKKERQEWALFINSLLERSPKRINDALQKANNEAPQLMTKYHQDLNLDASSFDNLFQNLDIDALTRNAVLWGMVRWISDTETLQYFMNMHWVIITQPSGEDHFLTGDTPVVVNASSKESLPIHIMSIALSPTKLLIMHQHSEAFDDNAVRHLAIIHNILIATQTEKFLVSSKVLNDNGHVKNKKILETIYANKFVITSRVSM